MSTAATHSPGHHTAIISSNYPESASASRQYAVRPSPADPQDESYYTSHDAYAVNNSSQRSAQSRRAPQQPQYNMSDDQVQYSRQNPTVTLPIHSRNPSNLGADLYDTAPVVPPRTTSQHAHSSSTAASTSRSARQETQHSQRYAAADRADATHERSRDENVTATRSRRRGPNSPDGPQASVSSNNVTAEQHSDPSTRSTTRSQPQPPPMQRENSEVINRLIVSDPLVDEERMRARIAEAQPLQPTDAARQAGLTTGEMYDNEARGPQRRQDYSKSKRREIQFGDYVLGQTLGEGEFGKVKLGWKKDGSSQVAIKLIRRESVATNPTRLPKIYREISILKELAHPNIVRLHEMVETERHIGIILEYASGGELFDYILNQRYLKDPSARRLFAQLVSGVGYLHKKGIVHRDLKLENLLLDQNKNIIITDFGFANTFNPADELSGEVEYNLGNKDFVRKWKLDQMDRNGMRKGDLMQTSCGSPCYAAPELVVSDSLYTGRKVDVWSCGVILYAMLAGYLPFDDDPANPEGDNINLLYKYITSTPLTFPEYVTPHARDLLRRILVPDPRKRADLFEVARHSWLTEYHHVVAHITSSTTNIADIANSTVTTAEDESNNMNRSASVRVPPSTSAGPATHQPAATQPTSREDQKRVTTRHTLQAEYVPPQQHTERSTATEPVQQSQREPEVPSILQSTLQKPLPSAPTDHHQQTNEPTYAKPQTAHQSTTMTPSRDMPPPVTTAMNVSTGTAQSSQYAPRPSTQGSMTSAGPTRSDLRLPSRGSYGQPVAPSVATTTAQGKVTQPQKSSRGYNISGPQYQHGASNSIGQQMSPSMATPPPQSASPAQSAQTSQKGHHRRSSTLSSLGEKLFGRSNSVIKKERDERQKNGRKYPPTSMRNPHAEEPQPRMSTDSKRSFSLGLRRKESQDQEQAMMDEKPPRRLSFLPQSSSFKGIFSGQKETKDGPRIFTPEQQAGRPNTTDNRFPQYSYDGHQDRRQHNFSRPPQSQGGYGHRTQASTNDVYGSTGIYGDSQQQNPSFSQSQHRRGDSQPQFAQYSESVTNQSRPSMTQSRNTLQKPRKDFNSGYDDHGRGGAVKRVQDFFRRRARARADSQFS